MNWKIAYVTGAGSGLGLWFTQSLLREKVLVIGLDLSFQEEPLLALQTLATENNTQFIAAQCDVTNDVKVSELIAQLVLTHNAPDLVIHCAGMLITQTFDTLTAAQFELILKVNVLGSRNLAAALLPHMQRDSQFAFVSSLSGLLPTYGYSAYNASKYAVVGLASAIRLEYSQKGITFSLICPPGINTPMAMREHEQGVPAITIAMKEATKNLETDEACSYIYKQLKEKRWIIIPGFQARMIYRLSRFCPWILDKIMFNIVKKYS